MSSFIAFVRDYIECSKEQARISRAESRYNARCPALRITIALSSSGDSLEQRMTPTALSWIAKVDFSAEYPGEPLVSPPIRLESPFVSAKRHAHGALYMQDRRLDAELDDLLHVESALLEHGPEAATQQWQAKVESAASLQAASIVVKVPELQRGSGYTSYQEWVTRETLPALANLSSVSASLYLSAIGRSEAPVPLAFARAMLEPDFSIPADIRTLTSIRAGDDAQVTAIRVDDQHRLVIHEDAHNRPTAWYHDRRDTPATTHILSDGWCGVADDIFPGRRPTNSGSDQVGVRMPAFEYDGSRLVALEVAIGGLHQKPAPVKPVIPLVDIAAELSLLFDDVRRDPSGMLDTSVRDKTWASTQPEFGRHTVVRRIVESTLRRFTPWPYPFRARTQAEQRLRPEQSTNATVALFDRFLAAPGPIRPTDLTAYFISLITRRRSEFAAWPESCCDVWGFKIKTGDHVWINGMIWHEPGLIDDPHDPVSFTTQDTCIEHTRFRTRYRRVVNLQTGSLRCRIECEDS